MENPLELPAPIDTLERVHAFALDLAYGAAKDLWSSSFYISYSAGGSVSWLNRGNNGNYIVQYIERKWASKPPSDHLMLSFRYLELLEKDVYFLTPKAFALLEKPLTRASVFISYKQTESSALALLIESRLKNVDPNISIFIDKNIPSGESINSQIAEAFEQSRFFICLLGLRTLADSKAVRDEISLAKSLQNCTIVPICHNGYTPDDLYKEHFGDNKAIVIKHPESAEEYEINITRLLIRLGYPTT